MSTQSNKKRAGILGQARKIRNLRQAKEFLVMSWRELSEQIAKPNGRGHYSHSELIAWSNGDRVMPEKAVHRVITLIANKLTTRYGREIAIDFHCNSPWSVQPVVWCDRCRKWYPLKRANQRCRKEHR